MRKNKADICTIIENGKRLLMDKNTFDYITQLKNRNDHLETELAIIKPVVAVDGMKPAIHSCCGECKFVVRNRWNNEIIGCCKGCVCDDFDPKGEQK